MPSIFQLLAEDPLVTLAMLGFMLLLAVAIALPLLIVKLYAVYFLLTLPLRRAERARLFLDLLELGVRDGHSPERAIVNAARSHDRSLGHRFHQLARELEAGLKLSAGLDRVPHLVPPPVAAMLHAGEQMNDVTAVLPACRHLLRDGQSQVRGALNYLLVLCFCVTPFMIALPVFLRIKILPMFNAIVNDMATSLPAFSQTVFGLNSWFTLLATLLLLGVWLVLLAYLGGPRLMRWLNYIVPGLPDALAYRLPWRRQRLRRDFSALLAVLLDAGVAEPEAVRLAAESTANRVLVRLAARVRAQLANGVPLAEALKALDDAGELHWRLANARPAQGGFRRALAGWHATLDARAFQLEQSAAQIATTSLVLLNGAIVAAFVFAVYLALIHLVDQATLW